jgi:hypothetical protein
VVKSIPTTQQQFEKPAPLGGPSAGEAAANRWRMALCAVGLLLVLVQHAIVLGSVPLYYKRVTQGAVPTVASAGQVQISNALVQQRADRRGLTLPGYALYYLGLNLGIALCFWGAAALVLWKAGGDWFRWLTALVLAGFPGGTLYTIVRVTQVATPYFDFGAVLWPLFLLFLYWFPNGRAVPRWSRWPMAVYAVLHFLLQLILAIGNLPNQPTAWQTDLVSIVNTLAPLVLLAFPFVVFCQIYRYWRVSGPIERKQIQWFVAGLAGYVAGLVVIGVSTRATRLVEDLGYGGDLGNALAVIIPVTITISILRYRLWDIDVIIRRTLIYSALSAVLALAYFGSVLVLQNVFQALTGESRNALVTVLSTLTIAAMFGPVRARVQQLIDRRFYRQKYDAARTLAAFGAQARDVVALEELTSQLVAAVDETMQPTQVNLWVRPTSRAESTGGQA